MTKKIQHERKPNSRTSANKANASAECQGDFTATKASTIFKLLNRTEEASIDEHAAATGWHTHRVRSYMSDRTKIERSLGVSSKVVEGCRHYDIALKGAGL